MIRSRRRRAVGAASLLAYRFGGRVRAKLFSLSISGAFGSFGRRTVVQPPARIGGERRIAIGDDVFVGSNCWLQTHPGSSAVALEIGDGTSIAGHCVFSAAESVRLGRRVLVARGVYVSDHIHAYEDLDSAVADQGLARIAPVEIADGAWLGENVVVGPGVRIGRGAVIGANAVVLHDVPDHSLAVGVPAVVVRSFAGEEVRVP